MIISWECLTANFVCEVEACRYRPFLSKLELASGFSSRDIGRPSWFAMLLSACRPAWETKECLTVRLRLPFRHFGLQRGREEKFQNDFTSTMCNQRSCGEILCKEEGWKVIWMKSTCLVTMIFENVYWLCVEQIKLYANRYLFYTSNLHQHGSKTVPGICRRIRGIWKMIIEYALSRLKPIPLIPIRHTEHRTELKFKPWVGCAGWKQHSLFLP